jgi:hypothetical protein
MPTPTDGTDDTGDTSDGEATPAPSGAELTRLWRFNRPRVAKRIVERAMPGGRFALFGPRQTGKTSLLIEEVLPAAREAGRRTVYIECWADRRDPAAGIGHALAKALDEARRPPAGIARTLRRRVGAVGIAGVQVELEPELASSLPASKYLRIDALLSLLLRETREPLLLVFDEFQAVAEAEQPDAVAAAVRAALASHPGRVGAVFSGSSEVQLLELFTRSRTPLYGFASPEPYPLLGKDFVAHVARRFKAATTRELPAAEALALLATLGHQPEPFLHAVAIAMAQPRWGLQRALAAMLDPRVRNRWTVAFSALTPIQRGVLVAVHHGLAPTSREGLELAAQWAGVPRVAASSAARALEALALQGLVERAAERLAERRPPVPWVVADAVMLAWLRQNVGKE